MIPIDRDKVEQMARVVGPHGAAAKALATADEAIKAGQDVEFFQEGSLILVVSVGDSQHARPAEKAK